METRITEEVKRDPVLAAAVEKADGLLRKLLERARHPPSATWRSSSLKQSVPSVELELLDDGDNIARDFRIDQLNDEREFPFAITNLWGDLIMLAYRRSTERLLDALREMRREEERRELQVQGA
jgi:hypothetical protein